MSSARHRSAPSLRTALAVGLALALWAPQVAAQVVGEGPPPPFPDARRFSRGFFAEGDVGALFYLGKMQRYAAPGPQLAVRLGYDLTRWLGVQAHVGGAISSADTAPPQVGQAFELFLYSGELRAHLQLRRVGLYAEAGAGAAQVSSNVLDEPKPPDTSGVTIQRRHFSAMGVGGLGIDLHTLNRHFSVGLAGDFIYFASFESSYAVTVAAFLKYTY